ncbi:Beta-soluble NSF attachment protein, partial [Giardia duodenalis]
VDGESPEEREHGYSSSAWTRRGAEVSNEQEGGMQDESGWTALTLAAYWNRLKCARLCAEKEKCIRTIRERFGCPPGTTALDIAKKKGYKKIVSILCE